MFEGLSIIEPEKPSQEGEGLPIIDYDTLKATLNAIRKAEHRCFLKTTYLSLARVGEVVKGNYLKYPNPPITKANFQVTDNFLIVSLLTEKRHTQRRVPAARTDLPIEQFFKVGEPWLTEDIIQYLSPIDQDRLVPLWGKTTRWGQKVFGKYFPEYNQHIHLLRHWRASHLLAGYATGVKIPDSVVAKMGGWKGTNTLTSTYDGTTIENYITKVK